jgi:hypothetical protein
LALLSIWVARRSSHLSSVGARHGWTVRRTIGRSPFPAGRLPDQQQHAAALPYSRCGTCSRQKSAEADRTTDFREVLPWDDSRGNSPLLCWEEGIPTGAARRPANNHRAAHRTGCTNQMSGAPRNSVKRDADRVRPLKSWRQVRLSLIGELGQLELIVMLPLVFTANVIVATIVWFVVGSLLR